MLSAMLDLSNLPKNHEMYDDSRAGQLYYWKLEVVDKILEYAGVRSKCYYIRTEKSKPKVAMKGVPRNFRSLIGIDAFRSALKSVRKFEVETMSLRSKEHQVTLQKRRITAFNSFDTKNYLTNCLSHSFPYGSRFIELTEQNNDGTCLLCQSDFNAVLRTE